ncbi:MAG: putative bifunctional diguanylate cyclase/phosphodiesterase [Chromatiales bacterium]
MANPTRARLVLLLCAVTLFFGSGLWAVLMSQKQQIDSLRRVHREEARTQFDRLLALKSESLSNYSYDYSYWDEMLNFVQSADPEWARTNLEETRRTFDVDALWVFASDFSLVYADQGDVEGGPQSSPPLQIDRLQRRISRDPFAHFFVRTSYGLLELSAAPIQPSADIRRETPPQGYMLAARLWDEVYLTQLGDLVDSQLRLRRPNDHTAHHMVEASAGEIAFQKTLYGWDEAVVATLEIRRDSVGISRWRQSLTNQFLAFIAFAVLLLSLLYLFLTRWVSRPLAAISDALKNGNDSGLNLLSKSQSEFGRISRMICAFFAQRHELLAEISERRQLQAELLHVARHDALTGLPNRHLFRERLEQAILQAERRGKRVAVLYVDLDLFKRINDSLGHSAGDLVLRGVAERLQECVRQSDTVARVGGDEYLLYLNDVNTTEDIITVANKIQHALSLPLTVGSQETFAAASIGISCYPDDGRDADTLVKHADSAMYRAKENGRNSFQFFDAALRERSTERLLIENALRKALERGELHVQYQPRVSLDNNARVGVEALLRWRHPELGEVRPDVFIPIAEDTGLIVPLGIWALREACRQHVAWRDAGFAPIGMAVNLSARQFREKNLGADILAVVAETGMDACRLELELTESAFVQNIDTAAALMRRLSAEGVRFSIDDFGMGYSSLSYLKRLPIHTIKIDRSFVRDLGNDPAEAKLVAGIISLARGLRLNVVAEGIESHRQLEIVRSHGCNEIQGYYICRPLPAKVLEREFLRPLPSPEQQPPTSQEPRVAGTPSRR